MFTNRLSIINKNQSGFTLVELMIAVAVSGLIMLGIMLTTFQVFGGNLRSSGEMEVVRQAQNAGYWISRDAQMAKEVEPGVSDGFPLTLTWYEYYYHEDNPADRDGKGFRVIYTLVDDKLKREYYEADEDASGDVTFNPDPDYTTFVAEYIESINCVFVDGKLTLTVTASVGGWQPQSETREYEVKPRPNVF